MADRPIEEGQQAPDWERLVKGVQGVTWANSEDVHFVLEHLIVTLSEIALARGVDLMAAKKIYDAYGADGASRLAEHEALVERVKVLEEALKQARHSHLVVHEDCWYSCPESGECCNDNEHGCNCGANYRNVLIDQALAQEQGGQSGVASD
jgi:hypothetical protein